MNKRSLSWLEQPSKYRVAKVVSVLGPAAFSLGWGLDVYVPAIPSVMDDFNSSQRSIQLTFGMFMLFCGLGQIVFGPLSDHFGRRTIAIVSGLLFTFGSVLCAISHNVLMLVLSRILEATGSCGLMVTAFAVIRDLFHGNEGASVYSYINSVISTAPIFGPIIGAYLDIWFGWRSVFVFLTGLGIFITTMMIIHVTDTQIAYRQLSFEVFRRYANILANLNFLCFALCAGVGLAVFFSFFSSSSFILIKILGTSEAEFGIYFGLVGVIYMVGSLVGAQVALKIGVYNTCLIGALFVLVGSLAMLATFMLEGLTLVGFLIPLFITKVGSPLLMGPGASGAMEQFPDMTGTASALLGCWQYLFAASVGTLVLQWEVKNNLPLCLAQLVMSCMVIVVLIFFREPLLKNLIYRGPNPGADVTSHKGNNINSVEDEEIVELQDIPDY